MKRAILLHAEGQKELKRILWRNVQFNNYSPIANYYIFRNGIFILKKYMRFDASFLSIIILRIAIDLVKIILYSHDKFNNLKQSSVGANTRDHQ